MRRAMTLRAVLVAAAFMAGAGPAPVDDDPVAGETSWPTDLSFTKCALKGLKDGRVTVEEAGADGNGLTVCVYDDLKRQGCATVADASYNEVKSSVACTDAKITVSSQMGFSAAESTVAFDWRGGKLLAKKPQRSDPSRDSVDEAEKLLAKGDIAGAAAAFDDVMYPDHYFDHDEVWGRLLVKARALAEGAVKKKDFKAAAATMKPAVAFGVLVLASPKLKGAVGALNDYGYFLDEAGDHAGAAAVLEQVVKIDPQRGVAYLNWGDALFAQKKDAAAAYAAYGARVVRAKWPKRVAERCGNACKAL